MLLLHDWDRDCEQIQSSHFCARTDKIFPFNSEKKRSSAVLFRSLPNLSNTQTSKLDRKSAKETEGYPSFARLYCKGASESVLRDCSHYVASGGQKEPIDESKRRALEQVLDDMAGRALRTLCLAHRDFDPQLDPLPSDWAQRPPDDAQLTLEMIVGIADPLRPDVTEAIATAQRAGIVVRMVTGDSRGTACAIARQCGILESGSDTEAAVRVLDGKQFRELTPRQLDQLLPSLRVICRSSPTDKLLLVQRLNGYNLPRDRQEWEAAHCFGSPNRGH